MKLGLRTTAISKETKDWFEESFQGITWEDRWNNVKNWIETVLHGDINE